MAGKIDQFWVGREEKLRSEGRTEGELSGIQETLLDGGRQKLGTPPPVLEAATRGTTDKQHLRRLVLRVALVSNWPELFAVIAPTDSPP